MRINPFPRLPAGRARLDALAALGFLLPNLLGFLAFTFLPIFASLLLSFTHWDGVSARPQFAGAANYGELLGFHREARRVLVNDPDFWRFLFNTLFLMLNIPLGMCLSLLCALLMNQRLRGVVVYRALFFLPSICSLVAVCVLWRWIYEQESGLLNLALLRLGVHSPPDWLGDPLWAKPALMLMGLWMGIGGYDCVLYLAALQGVPGELYEAAQLDGAGWWANLRHVTLPWIAPTTFFILTMSVISGFQGGFTAAYLMTGGGPAGATTTLMFYIYNVGFKDFRMGYAAAVAWVLFVMVLGFTTVNWKVGRAAREES